MAQRQAPKREMVTHRSDSYADIYANNVSLKVSLFDFEFIMGKILVAEENKLEIEQKASVMMSPQHAKELLRILADNIKMYESKFGPINSPVQTDANEPKISRPKRLIDLN